MRPDMRDLECFVAVAEELHFRRAATRLGLSQPTLSHRMQRLEELLGVALLRRDRRSVSLTDAGHALLDGAREVLAAVDRAVATTCQAGEVAAHRLVLGYVEYMSQALIPSFISALATASESVEIVRQESYSDEVLRGLLDRSIDVGVLIDKPIDDDLVAQAMVDGHWSLLVPAEHPLAQGNAVELAALASERLIFFARELNPPLFDRLRQAMRDAGFEPNIVYQTAQAMVGPELVRGGVGLFVVANYVLTEVADDLRTLPIRGLFAMPLYVAWHVDNRSRAIHLLRDVLRARRPKR